MGQTAAVLRLLLKPTISIIGLFFIINLNVVKIGNVFLWNIIVYYTNKEPFMSSYYIAYHLHNFLLSITEAFQ